MDSTTARQRRGTAKPSMKKNALRVLLALATGSATGQGAAPRALLHLPPQIAIFRGALPWRPDFSSLLEKRKLPCGFY